jgi:hypothetical protein
MGIFVFVNLDLRIRSGNSCMGIFVFVKLDLRIRSGNSCMGIFVFVNLDLRIRSVVLGCKHFLLLGLLVSGGM